MLENYLYIMIIIIEQELKNFKKLLDAELEVFLDKKLKTAEKISPMARGMVQNIKNYVLSSGKRIRPALMYHTYLSLAGKAGSRKKEALRAAMAPEFIHTWFIIHDDIIDKDDLRRGNPSMHYLYRKLGKSKFNNSADAAHYGYSQAISAGDMAAGFANEVIADSMLSERIKSGLSKKISDIIFNTAIGEFYDVFAAIEKNISEKEVLTILEYKTARYTVEGPIHLGAIMAEAGDKVIKNLNDYSVPLGIAYQIQDDILGVFGASKETGKPVGADIREGKKTLLVVKALEAGNAEQRAKINSALGNHEITGKEIREAQEIIKETGSLEYSRKMAKKFASQSNKALAKSALDPKSKEFFREVSDFIINRKY